MRKPALLALACLCGLAAFAKNPHDARQFLKQIPNRDKVVQALNRLTFGPRPGDEERVRAMGLKKWIDLQLHPGRIPENPVLTAKLKTLDTLAMSSAELVRDYPTPQMVRQMVAGQMPFPADPDRRMMIEKLVAKAERKQGQGDQPNPDVPAAQALAGLLTREQIRTLRTGTPQQRLAAFQALARGQAGRRDRRPARGRAAGAVPDRPARVAPQDRDGQRPAAGGGARSDGGQAAARHLQQPPARRSAGRFLVQPLQRLSGQGRRPLPGDGIRARRDPAARSRQIPRPAGSHGQEPGHAVLPGQLAIRGPERAAAARPGQRSRPAAA